MDIRQAKTIVAQNLYRMGVPQTQVDATVDMTKEQSLIEAAYILRSKQGITLDEFKFHVYIPELYELNK